MFGRKKSVISGTGQYVSEVTQFLNQLHSKDPELVDRQVAGRKLLWDKAPIDLDERSAQLQSRVEQPSYAYYRDYGDLKPAKSN